MSSRPIFSSRLTTVLTMIGVAVGLGNVWRFPYMMGKYGGSAFLVIYLIFTILFALPALMAEISLGRATRQGPVGAFRSIFGRKKGGTVGMILLVTILVASSYYSIIIANVIYAWVFSVWHGFSMSSLQIYNQGIGNGILQYGITSAVIVASVLVIYRGLNLGIEMVSKIFVPFFLAVILFLIYYVFTLEGSYEHIMAFLRPDFSALRPLSVFAALGQAVYSLSLGGTFMVVFGSYMDSKESIVYVAKWTAIGDIGAALLTSLFIVPAILVYQLDMTAGPTLIFNTLPRLFAEMPGGRLIGSLFLLALSAVAFLSLVAALQVAFSCLVEMPWIRWNKGSMLVFIGIIELILAVPSTVNSNLIGILDMIFGSGMQLIGSGLAVVAITWILGKTTLINQLSSIKNIRMQALIYGWMKWLIPLILLLVLIGYIYSTIFDLW